MSLDKNAKIYIAGHHGPVGSAIWSNHDKSGYHNLMDSSHKGLDPTDQNAEDKLHVLGWMHKIEIEDSVKKLYVLEKLRRLKIYE